MELEAQEVLLLADGRLECRQIWLPDHSPGWPNGSPTTHAPDGAAPSGTLQRVCGKALGAFLKARSTPRPPAGDADVRQIHSNE